MYLYGFHLQLLMDYNLIRLKKDTGGRITYWLLFL